MAPAAHRQLLLELNHVINVHSRLREVAADVVPTEDWSAWQELLAVPALAFDQGRAFLDDLRALGINSLDSVSLTPLPQTIAMAAYAHYQLVERAAVGLVGYLWFFERMPRLFYPLWTRGVRAAAAWREQGVARAGRRHRVVDSARDVQVADCCRQIVRRPRDLGLATQSLHDTADLFATMVDSALQRAETPPGGGRRSRGRADCAASATAGRAVQAGIDRHYDARVIYLIDASVYVFRAYYSMPPDMTDRDGHPAHATFGFARFLGDLIERARAALHRGGLRREPDHLVSATRSIRPTRPIAIRRRRI